VAGWDVAEPGVMDACPSGWPGIAGLALDMTPVAVRKMLRRMAARTQ